MNLCLFCPNNLKKVETKLQSLSKETIKSQKWLIKSNKRANFFTACQKKNKNRNKI